MGLGQIYNKQLDKAVLFWIWTGLHGAVGGALLLIRFLAGVAREPRFRPPLGDLVIQHGGFLFLVWLVAAVALWGFAIRDAHRSAEQINRSEVVIRYPMRRQMVHVLASQLLGFLPFVGLFFPPGVVAEAMDAFQERRRPERGRLLREGGQALVEWALTRAAFYGLAAAVGVWLIWWVARAARLAP